MRSWLAAGALVVLVAMGLDAQERPRVGVLGSPREGRPAPAVVAPYLTQAGAGPADQPFRLAAELGRVVVLVMGGAVDSSSAAAWRQVEDRLAGLISPRVILVGVARGNQAEVGALAGGLRPLEPETGGPLPTKLLADGDGQLHRAYGLGNRQRGWATYVVADDGRIAAIVRGSPSDPTWHPAVEAGVRRGRTAH